MITLSLLVQAAISVSQPSWLVGGWAPQPSSCGTDSGISFEVDGTYNDDEDEGVWSLAGDRITLASTSGDNFGRSDRVRVKAQNSAHMDLEWPDGTRVRFYRCG